MVSSTRQELLGQLAVQYCHIDITQASDPLMWECNEIVDKQATNARKNIEQSELSGKLPTLFQATKIGCVINSRLHNNDIYRYLKEAIN